MTDTLNVALAQLISTWLNKQATLQKNEEAIREAASQRVNLVAFGETLLPGYPFWRELT